MLNPLSLPNEVVSALRSVAAIERLLAALPDQIEARMRPHFSGQREDLARLHEELVASRIEAEKLPAHIEALRDELRGVLAELTEVRETVEPLQGPAERVARLDERLPGGG
jgi:septal ring factor EnvC (AmiA/AmiB activator)